MDRVTWIDPPLLRDPVAVVAFDGWGDAGSSATIALEHLLERFTARRVALIDSDEFFDFQVERPVVDMDVTGTRRVEWADTELFVLDLPSLDHDVVLVVGEEPHTRWKLYTRTVADVLAGLGVGSVVTLGAFAGQVSHSLPVPVVGSATHPAVLARIGAGASEYAGPVGVVGVLNHELSARGVDVTSLWAAVPHYLSNQDYPPGGLALLTAVAGLLGTDLEAEDLETVAAEFAREVDEILDAGDLRGYVDDLEARAADPADRLMSEIERFLRDR